MKYLEGPKNKHHEKNKYNNIECKNNNTNYLDN